MLSLYLCFKGFRRWSEQFKASLYLSLPVRFTFPGPLKLLPGGPRQGTENLGPAWPGLGWHPSVPFPPAGIKAASSGDREMPLPMAPPVSKQPGLALLLKPEPRAWRNAEHFVLGVDLGFHRLRYLQI